MTSSAVVPGYDSLRPEIAMSWRRAHLSGVGPESGGRFTVVDVDRTSRLAVAAAPVLEDLAVRLDGQPLCLILADRDCRVIVQSGDGRVRSALESGGVMIGSGLREDAAGTNGLGTAYELGREVSINGAEHYLHAFKSFSCCGYPVRHPLTRRLEGVLDITSAAQAANPMFVPLLARAARDIEDRLLDNARDVERRLFRAFQHATRQRTSPVAVLGGDTVLTNTSCLERLGSTDPSVLSGLASQFRLGGSGTRELELGSTAVIPVRAEWIEGTPDGVLLHLGTERPPSAPDAPPVSVVPTDRSVLVAGEPGTGRSTEALRRAGTGATAYVDAAHAVTGSDRTWAARLLELAAGDVDVVVVDDVDLLDAGSCTVVGRAMAASGGPRFVLTSGPPGDLAPHVERLVARCVGRVELPPLRERRHEIPALVRSLATRPGAGRELIFTPGALLALGAQPWPGNLVELANLVRGLTDLPSTRRIDVDDLPARYRPTSLRPGRGGRERAERVAILHALTLTGGNKLQAAEELGISRTTLYRRMRALAVPDDVATDA